MKHPGAIIKELQVTEKGTFLSEKHNKYLFKVEPSSNKIEIKKAVEAHYGVRVDNVNTMRYEGKKKRERTAQYGKRSDWKRAVVTLAEGHSIDLT